MVRAAAEFPAVPTPAPHGGLPLGILITAVLTPCVASAVTRFARR